ncbi:MAG: hypothetical protein EOO88_43860 [Pedobacter sp.]|nr:MAG: hypothetical protein EOO88_43860 [Pedobacter sp.]
MEFTVTIDPEVIDILGADKVNAFLQDAATSLRIKAAAQESLADIDYFDELVNDPKWQQARQQAWDQDKHRYIVRND